MPWGRILLALLVTGLALTGVGYVAAQLAGFYRVEAPSAPGLSQADAAALAAPFADLASGADARLLAQLPEDVDRTQAGQRIDEMQALLPGAAPTASRLVVWRKTQSPNGEGLSGVHEYAFPDHVARVDTALARANAAAPWRVEDLHLDVASRAELAQNQFTLAGKPARFIAVVAATIANPLFILATFLTALFWKGARLRWFWLIATLVGVGTLSMDGATGALAFNPQSVQLFGASAVWSGSAFEPWVFGVSAPLGALLFWLTRPFGRRRSA